MKTRPDWLKFRTRSGPWDVLEAIRPAFGTVGDLLTLGDQGQGKDGWLWRRTVYLAGDLAIAAIDYGGQHQREWVRVDIPGSGCAWVQDWQRMAALPSVLKEAEVKRLDLQLTTYHGEVTHDMVLEAHARGAFCAGGRNPHYQQVGSSDPRAGRTIYVGQRDAPKFARCYEKGFQLLQEVPVSVRSGVCAIEMDGVGMVDPAKVYRVEVELKAKDGREIPWDALAAPDGYFAGAYPFCAELLPGVQGVKVQTMPTAAPRRALATSLDNCRRSYGGILRAALLAYGGDVDRVMAMVTSEQPSDALVAAGVLTVDHVGAREGV